MKSIWHRAYSACVVAILFCAPVEWTTAQQPAKSFGPWTDGLFQWRVSEPLISVVDSDLPASEAHPWTAVKDPSIVRFQNRWHLFCTLRRMSEGDGRIRIGTMSFADWPDAQRSHWTLLKLVDGYHGAPQIFYFRPHKLWYLVYQAGDAKRGLKYGPCYSTNADINQPGAWTEPAPMNAIPDGMKAGLDYWIICEDDWAYLFFTTNDGKMWRTRTHLASFPNREWTTPEIALAGDIFEASHTYRILGQSQYLTLIEAQGENRRYFKAYLAESLDGQWRPLAAELTRPFVSTKNVVYPSQPWATSYSHGEIIRAGYDERLEISSPEKKLEILFQGANDSEYRIDNYSKIPWRLGLLKQN